MQINKNMQLLWGENLSIETDPKTPHKKTHPRVEKEVKREIKSILKNKMKTQHTKTVGNIASIIHGKKIIAVNVNIEKKKKNLFS